MMNFLYEMFAQIVLWFIGVAFDNNQIPDATTKSEQDSDPPPMHYARSVTSKPHEINEENSELNNKRDKCVQPGDNQTEERSIVTSTNETNNKEGNHNKNTSTNDKTEESEDAIIDNFSNDNGDIDALANALETSYVAYFAACDEMIKNNNSTFSTDDGESIQGYDSILESPPLHGPEMDHIGFQLADFVDLEDLEAISDHDLSIRAGPMPGLCAYCFRWEDQPDDTIDENDMVADKRFMFRKRLFFRRRKPVWAQCSACGFGTRKKVVRRRRILRVKKFLRKITGRE